MASTWHAIGVLLSFAVLKVFNTTCKWPIPRYRLSARGVQEESKENGESRERGGGMGSTR